MTRSDSLAPSSPEPLSWRVRGALALQRELSRASAALWLPFTVALMRWGFRWRIAGRDAARRAYQAVRRDGGAPLLVCANHLTMVDSALIAWALGSPARYLTSFSSLPWNVPERQNFAASRASRLLVYLMKCVPITRGGNRRETAGVLARLAYLLARGETVLIFPEGGRSRSGRVEDENAAYGVGRIAAALPGCRVLCVYLRGERQETFSDLPARGERFHVAIEAFEPRSDDHGLRRSIDLSRQIVAKLASLERSHFDARQ